MPSTGDMAKQKPYEEDIMMMSPSGRPVSILKSSSSWSSFVSCGPASSMAWSPIHEQPESNLFRPARKVSFEGDFVSEPSRGESSPMPCTPDHTACFYTSRKARHRKVSELPAPPPPPVPAWHFLENRKAPSPTEPVLRTPPHRPVPQRPPTFSNDRKSSLLVTTTVDKNTPTNSNEWPELRSNLFFSAIHEGESKCNSPSSFEKALESSEGEATATGFLLHWERPIVTSGSTPPMIPALPTTSTKHDLHHRSSLKPVDFEPDTLSKIPPKLQMRLTDPTNQPW